MEEVKTSNEWWHDHVMFKANKIYDPDGWDRANFHHSFYVEKITLREFEDRLMVSTMVPKTEK